MAIVEGRMCISTEENKQKNRKRTRGVMTVGVTMT